MARDIIADLWNTASESPRDLEIQQKIEWVKEATSEAIMDTFEGEKPITSNIHPTAKVHPTAQIDPSVEIPEGCEIGEGVVIEEEVRLKSQVTIWDHSTIKEWCKIWIKASIWDNSIIEENVNLWHQATIWNNCHIKEWCRIGGKASIWDNSIIEENVSLWDQVTIWDNCLIKEKCRIFHKTTVWKGSNIWMHSNIDPEVVIEENVTLWNYVRIQGPETTIGKKSVIWDNVSLTWYKDDNLKVMKIWGNCIIKGNPNIDPYFYGSYAPDKGLRYRRHSERISPPAKLLVKYKICTEILPNVIIDEEGKFEGFRTLDKKKEPKSLKENRSLERILTSLSDIVFKDIK